MIKRLADWPERFVAHLEATRLTPFQWGVHDCALWVAQALDAMCGENLYAEFSAQYTDGSGAEALVTGTGSLTLADLVQQRCGFVVKPAVKVQRGDVVWFPEGTPGLDPTPGPIGLLAVYFDAVWTTGLEQLVSLPARTVWSTPGVLVLAVPF